VAGAASLPLLDRLTAREELFAADLERLHGVPLGRGLRDRYLLGSDVTYLNHASIGTVPRAVHEAHVDYLATCETNPWLFMWGGAWEEAREATRTSVASLLGADPADVALTHNTTEGFNVLAAGLPLEAGDEVLFSTLNHGGASVCFEHMAARKGFRVRRFALPGRSAARMSAEELVDAHVRALRPETRLLVLPHVDNRVGVRVSLLRLVAAAKDQGVEWVAVDGAQTVGMFPLDLERSGVDFYAGSPHKWVQSPKGLGLLYVRPGALPAVQPLWVTWGQQRWAGTVRALEDYGTRNLPELLALGDAADFQLALGLRAKEVRYREMRRHLRERVGASSRLAWHSPGEWEDGASLVAVEVRGRAAPEIGAWLWERHRVVVRAFGGDLNALRISPDVPTNDADLDHVLDLLESQAR
jgi:selenocysteine lyase/cysteine desulfurase